MVVFPVAPEYTRHRNNMTRRFPFFRFVRTYPAIHALALIALLVSALAPQGFMPTQTTSGFAIKLCSGHAESKIAISPDNPDFELLALIYGQQHESDPQTESEPSSAACAFAGGASVGLTSSAPDFKFPVLAPAMHEPAELRRFALRNRINIPPATGPPAAV
ncbi:MAG: hypothetical protein ABJF89_13595 [Parasphingorhabdus sp.]|uniref:hypothetical protein n=2 Tax=Parasphingorhabdus sp. TaxID=2709688 RepID=UPI0032634449